MFLSRINGVYYLFFSDETGTRRKISTRCKQKHEANSFLNNFKQKEFLHRKKPKFITLSEYQLEYMVYASGVLTAKSQRTYLNAFREFQRIAGDIPIHTIGIREIETLLSIKKAEASEWTARKYFISLKASFEKAVQWEYITANLFRKVKKPKTPETSPVFLSPTEFRTLLSVIPEKDFRELCISAILTEMRLGELLSLKWRDLDFERKIIFIRNSETFRTKTQKNRVMPMNDELFRLLLARKLSQINEYIIVFSDQRGNELIPESVSQKFKRYVRLAGLNDSLHFHSLRHSFASLLVMSGVSLYAVQRFLGHSTSRTTQIYSHLSPQQLHKEVNTGLSKLIEDIRLN
jgi:site-specific recombinase XerD